jgi:hypothetical protein
VLAQFGAEGPQGAADQADDAAGMSAAAAAVDLAEPPAQQPQAGGAALGNLSKFTGHGTAIISSQEQNETIIKFAYPSGRII